MARTATGPGRELRNPRWIEVLFNHTEFAWLWLMARVYIGWHWLSSGWDKLGSDAWMDGGVALRGFWERAVAIPETGRPAIAYDWYREFLSFMLDAGWYSWFGPLVAIGEVVVGLALLVGIFTGIAAFFGAFMNWNFMLAGAASTNPVMGLIALLLVVAWKTAGWWGLDRWLLPAVGAPWQPGPFLGGQRAEVPGRQPEDRNVQVVHWVLVLAGVGLALFALAALAGLAQILVLLVAGILVAATGIHSMTAGRR